MMVWPGGGSLLRFKQPPMNASIRMAGVGSRPITSSPLYSGRVLRLMSAAPCTHKTVFCVRIRSVVGCRRGARVFAAAASRSLALSV